MNLSKPAAIIGLALWRAVGTGARFSPSVPSAIAQPSPSPTAHHSMRATEAADPASRCSRPRRPRRWRGGLCLFLLRAAHQPARALICIAVTFDVWIAHKYLNVRLRRRVAGRLGIAGRISRQGTVRRPDVDP